MDIALSMEDHFLHCVITDNGVGRQMAEEIKKKTVEDKKSLGLKITAERLALLNQDRELQTTYEMEDLVDDQGNPAGTRVLLQVRCKNQIGETK